MRVDRNWDRANLTDEEKDIVTHHLINNVSWYKKHIEKLKGSKNRKRNFEQFYSEPTAEEMAGLIEPQEQPDPWSNMPFGSDEDDADAKTQPIPEDFNDDEKEDKRENERGIKCARWRSHCT